MATIPLLDYNDLSQDEASGCRVFQKGTVIYSEDESLVGLLANVKPPSLMHVKGNLAMRHFHRKFLETFLRNFNLKQENTLLYFHHVVATSVCYSNCFVVGNT